MILDLEELFRYVTEPHKATVFDGFIYSDKQPEFIRIDV
jgi:hypothetical protein